MIISILRLPLDKVNYPCIVVPLIDSGQHTGSFYDELREAFPNAIVPAADSSLGAVVNLGGSRGAIYGIACASFGEENYQLSIGALTSGLTSIVLDPGESIALLVPDCSHLQQLRFLQAAAASEKRIAVILWT